MSESFERRRREREERRNQRRAKLELISSTSSSSLVAAPPTKFGTMAQAKQIYVKNIPIFQKCESDAVVEAISAKFERKLFKAGEVLARDGSDSDCVIYVSSGEVNLEVGGSDVGTLKQGASFGDIPCLAGRKRLGNVRARTDVVAYILARDDLMAVLNEHPEEKERVHKIVEEAQGGSEDYRAAERRVRAFFASLRAHGAQQPGLPEDIREDVVVTLSHEIKRNPMFANSSTEFVQELAKELRPQVYVEDDVVFQEGSSGDEMYLISSGRVAIIKGGVRIFVCERGMIFGEIALVDSAPRNASAVAMSPLDLLVLNKKQLDALLSRHPDEKAAIGAVVLQRQGSLASQYKQVRGRVSTIFGKMRRESSRQMEKMGDKERQDLTYAMNEQLRRVPLFRDADQDFVTELGKRLTPVVFDRGDFLYEEGDVGDCMYFVMDGKISMRQRGQEIMVLTDGSFVGEGALVMADESQRSTSAKAIEDLNTMRLRKQDMHEVLEKFPEQRVNILSLAQARLAQQAIQNLIGTPIKSEKEFQDKVGDLIAQAIHDKNLEIFRLEKRAKELTQELDGSKERATALAISVMHQKRIAHEAMLKLHRQEQMEGGEQSRIEGQKTPAAVERERKRLAARRQERPLRKDSGWNNPAVRKALRDAGRKRRFELGRVTEKMDFTKATDVTAMLQQPRLSDLLAFKSYVRSNIDEKWAHTFLESYGLAALIDCFVRQGDMLFENYFVIGGIQCVLFQTIELIFLALRSALYNDENAFFIEAYVLRSLDSFSSRLKNHSLQLLLELLQEVPVKGAAMVDSMLQRYRASPLRKALNAPRWTPLLDLIELETGTPLGITVMQLINAYIAAQPDYESRREVRQELANMGFGEILRSVLIDVRRTMDREEDEDTRESLDTWLQDFEDEKQAYEDAVSSENRDLEAIREELEVDATNLGEISRRLLSLVRSNPELEASATNVYQRLLLLTTDKPVAPIAWKFVEKILAKAMLLNASSDVDKSTRMSTADIAAFLRERKERLEQGGGKGTGSGEAAAAAAAAAVAPPPSSSSTLVDEAKAEGSAPEAPAAAAAPAPPAPAVEAAAPPPPPPPAPPSDASAAPPPPPPPGGGAPPPPPPPGPGGPPPPPPPGGGPPPPPGGPPGPPGAPAMGAAYSGPKPSQKVKPLFWNKLPPFHAKGTVWEEPVDEEVKIVPDFSELEDYFAVRNVRAHSTAEIQREEKKKDEVVSLLDMKRANNVNIVLSQFRDMTFEEIRDAVATADSTKLPSEKLSILVHYLPTDEEAAAVLEYDGDISKLGKAEQFYRAILQLPRFAAKAEGFFLRTDFDARIAELSGNIGSLSAAAHEISSAHEFRRLLDTILQIGNFLNSGTSRGNAIGFKFDALSKLKAVKATNETKITLMQYLAMFMERSSDDLAKLHDKYPSLSEALRLSVDQLTGDLEKLLSRLGAIEREVALSQKEEESRTWCEKMSTFLGRARVEVQKNKDSLNAAVDELTKVMKQYAVPVTPSDSGKAPQEEFLALFSEFVDDWKKAREDNVRAKRMMEKMKAREEKKRREALAKEEKRKRLMQAGGSKRDNITQQVDDVMDQLTRSGTLSLSSKGAK